MANVIRWALINNVRYIEWSKCTKDLVSIVTNSIADENCDLSHLASCIRPENIVYTNGNYEVLIDTSKTENKLLCPWDHTNCFYPIILSLLYLSTGRWIHIADRDSVMPPRCSSVKIRAILDSYSVIGLSEEQRDAISDVHDLCLNYNSL